MGKKVTTIPATLNRFNLTPIFEKTKRKVAGYARVSTDSEEQQTSYENQVDYYTKLIKSRDDWEMVGLYTDEGITATNTRHRDGFNKMVDDALSGKIDLIITKSVSRFARNTVDSLTTVRRLKEKGVEVFFEKENIWTLDAKGELLITIMSSLAQEESRSISENTTWGKRKAFADGKVSVAYSKFLGYDENFRINEKEAETIRLIYKLFLSGMSLYAIAKDLERRNLKTPAGGDKWFATTIKSILTNEKYKGDALLQKQYTSDFLDKKRKKNNGEIPQYYVEGHHEPIIAPETFDVVQSEMVKRCSIGRKRRGSNLFASKIKCGTCGSWYGPSVWHSNSKYRKVVFRCSHKYHSGHKCCTPHLTEDKIKNLFVEAINKVVETRMEIADNLTTLLCADSDIAHLRDEQENTMREIEDLSQKLRDLIGKNARLAQDQNEFEKIYSDTYREYEIKNDILKQIERSIKEIQSKHNTIHDFIENVKRINEPLTEFDEQLWCAIVDYIIIYENGRVTFIFKGDYEVELEC